jgi:predicted Zn-dependent protease with MMP-like domain
MTLTAFEKLVAEALDNLPESFGKHLDNVEIVVEVWPTPHDLIDGNVPKGHSLFGLYRGIPKTKRNNYTAVLPDKISIFAGPIVTATGDNPSAIKTQVKNTVLHEIGHHFGLSEEEIQKATHR